MSYFNLLLNRFVGSERRSGRATTVSIESASYTIKMAAKYDQIIHTCGWQVYIYVV